MDLDAPYVHFDIPGISQARRWGPTRLWRVARHEKLLLPAVSACVTLLTEKVPQVLTHPFPLPSPSPPLQAYILFRGRLAAPHTYAAQLPESLEAALFAPEDIPWGELAFSSVSIALRRWAQAPPCRCAVS